MLIGISSRYLTFSWSDRIDGWNDIDDLKFNFKTFFHEVTVHSGGDKYVIQNIKSLTFLNTLTISVANSNRYIIVNEVLLLLIWNVYTSINNFTYIFSVLYTLSSKMIMQEVIFNEKNERNCYFAGFYEMSDFII